MIKVFQCNKLLSACIYINLRDWAKIAQIYKELVYGPRTTPWDSYIILLTTYDSFLCNLSFCNDILHEVFFFNLLSNTPCIFSIVSVPLSSSIVINNSEDVKIFNLFIQ